MSAGALDKLMSRARLASMPLAFDLCDADGLLFDEEPYLFVDLTRTPVMFTIRGIRYFSPRFRSIGLDISRIDTRERFDLALSAWMLLEFELLHARFADRARQGVLADPYNALLAVLHGDSTAFERHIEALERRARSGLHVVPPDEG
jgi:hypothetical protein